MESDFAGLTLNEEEEAILQIPSFPNPEREEQEFCLVGMDMERVLKGSPWTFNNHLLLLQMLNWGEYQLKVPLVLSPFWVQIHDIPAGFFSEALAKQLGDFIGTFMEYDGANMEKGDSFCEARMALGVETTEMGWDLSLRAQTRRARAQNSVWLCEDDEGIRGGISTARLPKGKPTGNNENLKLERPWFGESTDSTKTSTLAEVI
ncbi:hypothetical protein CXB51_003768 [Gossypium anomalum]|uniref:DUF4283 domain-containing protein n=1 Tax=Gossypium anomalum TaxID=47600 RepID=A0A8J5ZH97_9ROSI|nr:hypothetical protein CXB51_003768 [Gossypium anomalum]